MKAIRTAVIFLALCGFAASASAQNFSSDQQKQEAEIKAAYKAKQLTENEYVKLMKEQFAIKKAMERYAEDEVWTASEKNNIVSRLKKCDKRFEEFKNNSEVY